MIKINEIYKAQKDIKNIKAYENTWDKVKGKPSAFPPESHNHDLIYYTKEHIDSLGVTGPQGPTGEQGNQGLAGDTWKPQVTFDGELSWYLSENITNPTSVNITGPKGNNGEMGLPGPLGPKGLKGDTGVAGVAGLSGMPGARGPSGIQGITGKDGLKGEQGNTGPKGITGDRWRPAVNSDGNISFIIDNTPTAPTVINIKGPTGATGPKGSTGNTGSVGPIGPKGAQGLTGTAGTNGKNGATGAAGPKGATGAAGPKGSTGAAGPVGSKGNTGGQGATGPKGSDGLTTSISANGSVYSHSGGRITLPSYLPRITLGTQNLNDMKSPGIYSQDANANTSGKNYPEASAGCLTVTIGAGTQQRYHVYNSSRSYTRGQYNTSAWTTWAREYNTLNKPSATDVGARASNWVPSWSDITGKPSTYSPASHSHSYDKFGVSNSDSTTGKGMSLYGGANIGQPSYGLMFAGTGTFGKHGYVQGDWATYLTMTGGTNRGWIFKHGSGSGGNVASIDGSGNFVSNMIESKEQSIVRGHAFLGWAMTNSTESVNSSRPGDYGVGLASNTLYFRAYGFGGSLTAGPAQRAMYLGSDGHRWKGIYSGAALNISSDRRLKENISDFSSNKKLDDFYKSLKPCSYTMKDGDTGRTHYGFIAQEVEEAMTVANMNYKDCAFLQKSPLDIKGSEIDMTKVTDHENDNRIADYSYGLGYTELISVNTHFIQKLQKEVAELREIIKGHSQARN